jgi:ABC-type nickel/cobalt efflux system permease component RcnA
MKRLVIAGAGMLVAGAAVFGPASAASAHPLGNLTVNTSAHIVVAPEQVSVTYVLDLAELPTVQERPAVSAGGDGYAAVKCASLGGGLTLAVDGDAQPLTVASSTIEWTAGQGGLDTLRVECALTAAGAVSRSATLDWHDANFADRIGWREVVVNGDRLAISTSLPSASASEFLRSYPSGVPAPRVLDASASVQGSGARLDPTTAPPPAASTDAQRRGSDGLTAFFNRLVGDRDLTVGLGLLAAGLAFLLGALHSLAPGHGKTVMAAMIASRRGTLRQVMTVGGTVAVTHTFGVVVLGVVISTSQVVAPDRVLPWLTVASGVLLLGTGAWLLLRRWLLGARVGAAHHHGHHHHGHRHHHGVFGHDHHHDAGAGQPPLKTRSLALIGMAGGLVPTPSALVVLLGATALGRAWFGVLLVGIYGIGMAATLLAAGVLLVKIQGWLERQYAQARWLDVGMRLLPIVTSLALILGGVSLAVRGVVAA